MARKWVHYSASVASGSGTVSPLNGTKSYDTSSASSVSVTFTATPSSGYEVNYWWFRDAAGTYSPRGAGRTSYTFPADMDFECRVYFKSKTVSYTVTVEGSHCSVSGGGSYTSGSTCTAKCTPDSGYYFRYWEDGDGDIVSYSNPYSFTVTKGTYLYAVCGKIVYYTYELSFDANGGTGAPPKQSGYTSDTSKTFEIDDDYIPTRSNYIFDGYSFNQSASSGVYQPGDSVTLSYDNPKRTLFAIWRQNKFYLYYSAAGGTIVNDRDSYVGSRSSWTFRVYSESESGVSRDHYDFQGWADSSGGAVKYRGGEEITLNTSNTTKTIYAVWKGEPINITTVVKTDGVISSSGGIIDVVGTGTHVWDYGSTHVLKAIPNEHYHFVNWTDGTSSYSTSQIAITVTGAKTYTANFEKDSYLVSCDSDPSYAAAVHGAGTYKYGDTAIITCTITDTHFAPSNFTGWYVNGIRHSGDIYTGCSITVTDTTTVQARFSLPIYNISVSNNPYYGGTVSGAGNYTYKSVCRLTATANDGYDFVNWTKDGEVVGTSNVYTISSVSENVHLVANFKAKVYTIQTNKNIPGAPLPVVSGGPEHAYGTICFVTVQADPNYELYEWRNSAGVVLYDLGHYCSFTVTKDDVITAYYNRVYTYRLTYNLDGGSGGPDNPDPVGPTTKKSQTFDIPNIKPTKRNYVFKGWSWSQGGSIVVRPGGSVTLTYDNPSRVLYAVWEPATTYTVYVTTSNNEVCTVTGGGDYTYGDLCTVTATIKPQYTVTYSFDWWKDQYGTEISQSQEYTFMVTGNTSLVAWVSGNPVEISVSSLPGGYGTTDPSGRMMWGVGTTHKLTAIANRGYEFDRWVRGGEYTEFSRDAITYITVEGIESYAAIFKKRMYEIQLVGRTGCTVHLETTTGPTSGSYEYQSTCRAICIVDPGYEFVEWAIDDEIPVSTLVDYSFEVTGAVQLYAVVRVKQYFVRFSPGVDNPRGEGPYPNKHNVIACSIDTWYQYPPFGWEYYSKLHLNPGEFGEQKVINREVYRPGKGWYNSSTAQLHYPGESFINIGERDSTVDLDIQWDSGEYKFIDDDISPAQDWSKEFLYYTLVLHPEESDRQYRIGDTLSDISKDHCNVYAQWSVIRGNLKIKPYDSAFLDKVIKINTKYYTTVSNKPIEGYVLGTEASEWIEKDCDYSYSIEVEEGYTVKPVQSGSGRMEFEEEWVPYTRELLYKVVPVDVVTKIVIDPGDEAGSVWVLGEKRQSGSTFTFPNGAQIRLVVDQTLDQRQLYTFVGWYDADDNLLSTDREYDGYIVDYNNAIIKAKFVGNPKVRARVTPYTVGKTIHFEYDVWDGQRWFPGGTSGIDDNPELDIPLYTLENNHVTFYVDDHYDTSKYTFNYWNFGGKHNPNKTVTPSYNIYGEWWKNEVVAIFGTRVEAKAEVDPPEAGVCSIEWNSHKTEDKQSVSMDVTATSAQDSSSVILRTTPSSNEYRFKYWMRKKPKGGIEILSSSRLCEVSVLWNDSESILEKLNHYYAVYGDADSFSVATNRLGIGNVEAQYKGEIYPLYTRINDLKSTDSVVFRAWNQEQQEEEEKYFFKRWVITDDITGETTYNQGTKSGDANILTLSSWTSDYTVTAEFATSVRAVTVTVSTYGANGAYDGTCAGYGMLAEKWAEMCSPYYNTGPAGQCTWYAHGRTAQMRGNPAAGAPFGNGSEGGGFGDAVTWDNDGGFGGNWERSTVPHIGDVAVYNSKSFSPTYGHVAVVESIGYDSDFGEYIIVSEWNRPALGLELQSNVTKLSASDISNLDITFLTNSENPVINITDISKPIVYEDLNQEIYDKFQTVCTAGYVEISDGNGVIDTESTQSFAEGDFCSIKATPTNGYRFMGWMHNGHILKNQYISFSVNDETDGVYLAMFWIPGYYGHGGDPDIPPTDEDLLESMYMVTTYYYYRYSMSDNDDYWNYKYNKWLNLGDKNRYDIVEYIESTGEHYINTLYKCNNHIQLEVKGNFTSTDSLQTMGYDGWNNSYEFGINSSGNFFFVIGDSRAYGGQANTNSHIFLVDVGTCMLDSTRYATNDYPETSGFISLFSAGAFRTESDADGATLTYPCKFRMTGCRIWDDGELVRDFIPVKRRSDNATGLWDSVYKKFYRNLNYTIDSAGQTVVKEFITGPVVRELNKFTD